MKNLRLLAVITLFVVVFADYNSAFPLHASCHITWKFGIACKDVSSKLVAQIKKWSTKTCPKNGRESCNYKLKSSSASQIKATHTTPVHRYVDDLTFSFSPSGSMCNAKGYSSSTIIFAIFDKGTNYCNLHNLITGSGLNHASGYKETTSDSVCTQYSSANCTYY